MRFAVFASGNGSNFEAILKAVQRNKISAELVCLFSDKSTSYAVQRAKDNGVPYFILEKESKQTKEEYETKLVYLMQKEKVDCIVLAGYMKILGKTFLTAYPNRVINIHPSLLPHFPGKHGIKDAFDRGVKKTGITIHQVDDGIDTGPIIFQKEIETKDFKTLEELEEKIHELEHKYYPIVIEEFVRELMTE